MKEMLLGNTGKSVSALSLGCMLFGSSTDEKMSYTLLDQYTEAGGRFLDTANNYAFWVDGFSGGESERLIGRWLKERGNRQEIFLATKVGANPTTVPGGDFSSAEGLSAAAINTAVDASLERLQTDYIDLYYAHIDHRQSNLEETLGAFNELVESGKVRHIACSNMTAWRIEQARGTSEAHGWASYCGVQQRYSYLRPKPDYDFGVQEAVSEELLDYCREHVDFTLLAYSPLLGGSYTRADRPLPEAYVSTDSDARLKVLREVAAEVGATPNQIVIAWMLQGTPTVLPVVAASRSEQLTETLAATEVTLSAEQLERLHRAG